MNKADELSEVKLVGEIDRLDEVSEVRQADNSMSDDELDEDYEVHQADK